MNKIRIGVVGVGHLGQHHLHHLLNLEGVSCGGFYDIDLARSEKVSTQTGAKAFHSLEALIENTAALSIVVPTKDHYPVAEKCILAGKHIFIEKPICSSLAEADRLVSLAKERDVLIQVGHIERFNPAVLALNGMPLTPRYIETHRLAPYTARGTDVPVVLDLMIHDLDIILSLVKAPVVSVHASGISIMTKSVDIANARLRFENGCVANITSSRIATGYERRLRIFQKDLYIHIDFLRVLTEIYRVIDTGEKDPNAIVTAPLERDGMHRQIVYEKPEVKKTDALEMELKNFVRSLQKEENPLVSGFEGREVLRVALMIQEKIEQDIH